MATTVPTPTAAPGAAPGLFTRQATGLVRGISPRAGIALNIAFLGPPLIVLGATQIPSTYIGGSSTWSSVIGALICVFPILSYALFTVAMPRSGGDYVFVGRSLHPWLGFIASFNMAIFGFTIGLAADVYLGVTFGLSTTLSTIGTVTGSATLMTWSHSVTTSAWAFGIGAGSLAVIGLMLSLRLRWMLRALEVLVGLMIVGLVVTVGLLAFNSHSDFIAAVHRYGGSYTGIIHSAAKAGFTPTNGFSMSQTLLAIPFTIGLFVWSTGTSYVGGELRNPRRSALAASVQALAIVAVVSILLFALAEHVFGDAFLGSATYLSNAGAKAYPFSTPSFFFFFVTMLTHSTVLAVIMGLGFMASYLALCATLMLGAVRSMFAWSFDRVAPSKLAYVTDQGAPIVAVATSFVLSTGYLAFISFGSSSTGLKIFFTVVVGQLLTFALVGAAAAVFPYRKRDQYEHSFARWSIGGVPLMAVIGVLSVAVIGYAMWGFLDNDALGANNTPGLISWWICLAIGTALWPAAYFFRKRQGIDLLAAGRELPPE